MIDCLQGFKCANQICVPWGAVKHWVLSSIDLHQQLWRTDRVGHISDGGWVQSHLAIKSIKGRDTLYCLFRLITGLNQSWWTQQRILYDNLEVNDMRSLVLPLCFCPASNQRVRPSDRNPKREQLQILYLFCQRTHTCHKLGTKAHLMGDGTTRQGGGVSCFMKTYF